MARIWRALFGRRRAEATIQAVFRRRKPLIGRYTEGRRVLIIRFDGISRD